MTTCTYLGDSTTACGCAVVEGRSYCTEHLGLVYKLGTGRAQRKRDKRVAAAVWDLESEFNQAVEELIAEGYDFAEERWDVEDSELELA
jgi:hypothetical protein